MTITEVIRRRRSVFPPVYNDRPIDKSIIEEILENANWAPNHRLTEPWRFKVFTGKALKSLSDFLAAYYQRTTPAEKFSEMKYKKTRKKPLQSACVIAICMQRDPEERLPEWEEVAAVSCAVQNMWLTATAHGIGAYWSSPGAINAFGELVELAEGERCLGFFFMGYTDSPHPEGKRKAIGDKVQWL
ncbi:MAG: nitroreductase [Bacteroidota bacterium]